MKLMLASKAPDDLTKLRYPTTASFKLDGIRATVIDGKVYSRNMKLIPSRQAQREFGRKNLNGLDGELIAGPPNALDVYRRTMSAVMSGAQDDSLVFYVFDYWQNSGIPHENRLRQARQCAKYMRNVTVLGHAPMRCADDILEFEAKALTAGYEGVMLRDPAGHYKFGRATTREGTLLKLKRFEDSEAVIHSCKPLMHNDNELEQDELGRAKRSSKKAGLVQTAMLGALIVQDIHTGAEFDVGAGFDNLLRVELWRKRTDLSGQVIKYRFFPIGNKHKPRFPVFVGFRDRRDM